MKEKPTAMYIHIPFCKHICSYCDFCKMEYHPKVVLPYLEQLKQELLATYHHESLRTLYIGGGTPSVLSLNELSLLFSFLDTISLQPKYEFTFECNIESITKELLSFLKQHRVNRLSIGIQTVNPQQLQFLNRFHTKEMVVEKMAWIRSIGFQNVNIDLMYAFPSQTIEDLEADLTFILELDVEHISTYSLMIEPHTKLYIDCVKPINQDLDFKFYQIIQNTLQEAHFIQYEISNFAKHGFQSRHNLTYWNNQPYYGLGLGASGYVNHIRYTNTCNLTSYCNQKWLFEREVQSKQLEMENQMILGLRKLEGVSKSEFEKRFHKSIAAVFPISFLLQKGLLLETATHYRIPKDKLYLSNEILIHFIHC